MEAQTPRQAIADLLRTGPCTALDVARKLGFALKRVVDDLEHVRRSVRSPERWTVEPAECLGCGFVRYNRIAADDNPILLAELPIVDQPETGVASDEDDMV